MKIQVSVANFNQKTIPDFKSWEHFKLCSLSVKDFERTEEIFAEGNNKNLRNFYENIKQETMCFN
jgi:hypothetical protein